MKRQWTCLVALLGLFGCRDGVLEATEGIEAKEENATRSGGSRLLPLKGVVFRMGSDDGEASPEERPGWVRFSRDVWMDTTEMTQAEYASLARRNPSRVRGDDLPVTDVTWFDAALAANARSRRDGLDSVYRFDAVVRDSSGSVIDLPGLAVLFDREGWRLPTEAEWEAAARSGTTTPYPWGTSLDFPRALLHAWSQPNSSGRPHPVGKLQGNAWGLHDMAGNVMEWVGDWKCAHPSDTIENFVGQESPGDVAEVPLKGGAFNYGASQLRPSARTATYAAFRSSRAEYVGFRLARGGFTPRYSTLNGQSVEIAAVSLSAVSIPKLAKATAARLVFVNRTGGKGVLSWVDYAEPKPVTRSLPDPDPVFHPAISPDGQWVAWCTALEGSLGPSKVKIRRLARNDTAVFDLGEGAIPRWWVAGSDTFLILAGALDNSSGQWRSTSTKALRWARGTAGPRSILVAEGSFHDGRSGDYLYTGYRRLRQVHLPTGNERVLFTFPENGKAEGDTSQVCNVSAAPDPSGRVLFLDFGYTGVSKLIGRPYGIHEVVFVADSLGRVQRRIEAPAGERQWEHTEWSNLPRWAVSGSIDPTGAYRNLYAIDLETGSSERLATGQELWQPALWIGGEVLEDTGWRADRDSLGDYAMPEIDFRFGSWWSRASRTEAVYLGSSHASNGILPLEMGAVAGHQLSVSGSGVGDQDEILRSYVIPNAPRLRVVVNSFMPGWMYDPIPNPLRSPWVVNRSTRGYLYDKNHGFWTGLRPRDLEEASRTRVLVNPSSSQFDSAGGYLAYTLNEGWSSSFTGVSPIADQTAENPLLERNMSLLEGMVKDATGSGLLYVLVKFPESPAYASSPIATRYGPDWSSYRELCKRIRSWEAKYPGFVFYDAHQDGRHDYRSDEAQNTDHLNMQGARKLSRRLDSLIRARLR